MRWWLKSKTYDGQLVFDTKILTDGIKTGVNTIGKTVTVGIGTAVAGISALGTAAVNSFADYEQLVGGIETLFGTRGAKSVEEYAALTGKAVKFVGAEFEMLEEAQTLAMQNAAKAYETAGMSANGYMETVSGFAASLKQSTASELEAAEKANRNRRRKNRGKSNKPQEAKAEPAAEKPTAEKSGEKAINRRPHHRRRKPKTKTE